MKESVKMITKGIDVGYGYTKDNNGVIFKSAYSLVDKSLNNSNGIIIDGVTYYMGYGNYTTDQNKSNSTINKVCTIYDLVLNSENTLDNDYVISVGLPISQYKTQKISLEKSILDYNKSEVYYRGNKFKFNIRKVIVSPQSAASIYNIPDLSGEYVVIDIGGGTIDSCLLEFENRTSKIIHYSTTYDGIKTLFSSVIDAINNKYELKLDNEYAEKILLKGKLQVEGKDVDLTFLSPILQEYIDKIVQNIKINYPIKTSKIILVGGGAILTHNQIKKHIPYVELIKESQFANARGYYLIAKSRGV